MTKENVVSLTGARKRKREREQAEMDRRMIADATHLVRRGVEATSHVASERGKVHLQQRGSNGRSVTYTFSPNDARKLARELLAHAEKAEADG